MSQIVIPKTMVVEVGGKSYIFTKSIDDSCYGCLIDLGIRIVCMERRAENKYCARMSCLGIKYICTEIRDGRY